MRAGRKSSPGPAREERWVGWREQRLVGAGFPAGLARSLAGDRRVDIHSLLELLDRGCAPHLAARIMAPLDPNPE